MRSSELVLIQAILDLIINYGIEGFLAIMRTWEVKNPSIEDIEALRSRIKHPKEYFKEDQ